MQKFRAWDKVKQAMCPVETIDYVNNKIYPFYRKTVRKFIPFDETVPMESTTMFDKNDVEIFEADVVKMRHTINDDFEFFKVTKSRGGTWLVSNRRCSTALWLRNNDCEVVGNVWENPELLERVEE